MHELSIMTQLLDVVEEEARRQGARGVRRIDVVIGERLGVIDDSLLFCFDLLSAGTLAEGASLEMRRVPMRFRCDEHGDYGRQGDEFFCPVCGRVGRQTEQGSELFVESMEIER
ncbi:MAG: hydrogenase maturation nickel metallochaperone HypA [Candidatus Dormibacteraeota bacterium]|nr:hydrogenase maturation nickel metallochaperone HypA [Candidatus Dormibacteraeota bacterium]MBO0744010.1 hydrogenase maturation nickel metallochaperone HypA [Candidatus Dormibacteraeota bacterium]